jgi:hypothetical protein
VIFITSVFNGFYFFYQKSSAVKKQILRLAVHVAQRRQAVSWLLTYYWAVSGEWSTPKHHHKFCSTGGKHTANYRGCSKYMEAKAALAKRGHTERRQANGATGRTTAPKPDRAGPLEEQKSQRTRLEPRRSRGGAL